MRNRTFTILIFALLILSQHSFALGNKDVGTITAVVYVRSLFQLSVNQGTVDFKTASHGKMSYSDSDVAVVSRSSTGNTWYVHVHNDRPLVSGEDMISNNNFLWGGESQGDGEFYGERYNQFETIPKVAYISAEEEGNNIPDGTKNNFKFRLFVPENQPAGTYSCKVIFTMTE